MVASGIASSGAARAARTRYLIQLGALVVKAGLPDLLGLRDGADLQRDHPREAAALIGAMLEAKEQWITDSDSQAQATARGAAFLRG